jgi:putative ABC transport system permease protein
METLFGDRVMEAGERGPVSVSVLLVRELADVVWTAWRLRWGGEAGASKGRRSGSLMSMLSVVVSDISGGVRQGLRHPSQSLMAFAVIALGIGATTSMFAIVDSVALRPLAHEDPDRLVVVGQTVRSLGAARVPMSWPNYMDLRSSSGTGLSDMAAFRWPVPLRVWLDGGPESVGVSPVSGGLFELLGNAAEIGRVIGEPDDAADARVAVLSYGLWRSRFGGDRRVLGASLTIESQSYEIVGVMGPEFSFPVPAADVFIPQRHVAAMDDRDTRFIGVVGRLESDVSLEAARLRMGSAMERLVSEWPVENEGNGIRLDALRAVVLGDAGPAMRMLLGAVMLLLLLSCASVANLLLARTSSRTAELAMRRALGASRGRLVSQLLGESLVVAVAGGGAGLLLALVATSMVVDLVPASLPRAGTIGFDVRTFAFAAAATIASGVLFGLAPALRGSASPSGDVTRLAAGGVVGRSRHRLLRSLVAAQVSITVVLLVGAGLLVNSLARLATVDTGMDIANVVTMRVGLTAEYDDPARVDAFFDELIERSAALPGVTAAGATWALPFTSDWASGRVTVEGDPKPRGAELVVGLIPVRGRYFTATGMRLVEGRWFEPDDYAGVRARLANLSEDSPPPAEAGLAVINEAAARAMWPGEESVVGRRFRRGRADETAPWFTVVGVVRDAKRFGLARATEPEVYQMHPQALWARDMSLVVRTDMDVLSLVPPLTRIVRNLDASLAVTQVGQLDDFVRRSLAEPRFRTVVVATFAAASLILAIAGIYGVLAFTVSLRTREIGIRMALGADRARVLGDVLREGGFVVLVGLAVGLLGAAAGAGAVRSQLFDIGPFDFTTWLVVVVLVVASGTAGCWIPARRASHVAPASAMRE